VPVCHPAARKSERKKENKTDQRTTKNINCMSARERILSIRNRYLISASPFLRDLKEAIAGTDQDFTEGRLSRAIFLLSVPMVLEMVMESMFAVADIFFVSKLGPDAIATVGITESMITIVYAIGFGLAMSTSSLVSRRIGEKNREGAAVVPVGG
jgi:hypothetical protein